MALPSKAELRVIGRAVARTVVVKERTPYAG